MQAVTVVTCFDIFKHGLPHVSARVEAFTVNGAAGDFQQATQSFQVELLAMVLDECVLHLICLAKYALAFFKMHNSITQFIHPPNFM